MRYVEVVKEDHNILSVTGRRDKAGAVQKVAAKRDKHLLQRRQLDPGSDSVVDRRARGLIVCRVVHGDGHRAVGGYGHIGHGRVIHATEVEGADPEQGAGSDVDAAGRLSERGCRDVGWRDAHEALAYGSSSLGRRRVEDEEAVVVLGG